MSGKTRDIILYSLGMFSFLVILLPYSPMTIDLLLLPRRLQIDIYVYRHFLWIVGIVCFAVSIARGTLAATRNYSRLAATRAWTWAAKMVGISSPVWLKITGISTLGLIVNFWSGYVPFVMTPPSRYQMLNAAEADKLLRPDAIVLGFVYAGQARAYPREFISRPHFFPDTVGGTPVTISYCVLCNSAIVFKSELNGKPLKLKAVTAYNNNIIYLDQNSGDFIQQLDGKVIYGPDKGQSLQELPVVLAAWDEWERLHPDTQVYYAPPITIRDKLVAAMLQWMVPVPKLAKRSTPFHRVRGQLDDRLPAMSLVYGVEVNGDSCAYPGSYVEQSRVIDDTVGQQSIVVLFDAQHAVGNVYSRQIGGKTLSFSPASGPPSGVVARDAESGSLWDVNGVAVAGELSKQSLRPIAHFNKLFWFSWALFKPHTRLKTAASGQS